MGLPGHRRSSSHKRHRSAHFALRSTTTSVCPNCSAAILPHRACVKCGYYRGRAIKKTKTKTTKK